MNGNVTEILLVGVYSSFLKLVTRKLFDITLPAGNIRINIDTSHETCYSKGLCLTSEGNINEVVPRTC